MFSWNPNEAVLLCLCAGWNRVCGAKMRMSCFTKSYRAEEEAWQCVTAHQRWLSALETTGLTKDKPLTDKSVS